MSLWFVLGQVDGLLVVTKGREGGIRRVRVSELKIVAGDTDEHVDDVENPDWGRVGAVEILLANFTETAFDGVEAIWDEIVGVGIDVVTVKETLESVFVLAGGIVWERVARLWVSIRVFINVSSKWFFVSFLERFKVCTILEELDDTLFDVCKSKEFFDTHVKLAFRVICPIC